MIKTYELTCIYDNHKSFYGKAIVKDFNDVNFELYSYGRLVCTIKKGNYYLYGLKHSWDSDPFTMTTRRHIKEFISQYSNVQLISNSWKEVLEKATDIKNYGEWAKGNSGDICLKEMISA